VFCVLFFCFYIVSGERASRPNKRLMRTYHWISLFMSHIKWRVVGLITHLLI
jgi:hypothetical protein